MATDNCAAPVWEASKENIGPVKSGRSTKKLGESVLSAGGLTQVQLKQKQKFEEDLKIEEEGYSIRLDTFVEYFKWSREVYPSNTAKSLEVLEKCTFELQHIEEVKNNPKFVKMWIAYADLVKAPGELFTYMNSNKIGEKVALFWLAWAWVAENAENFKLADQIYQKGLRRQAEPKDQLSKRYQQFQRRLARHYINQSESGASEPERAPAEPTRKALSKLGESQAVSSVSRAVSNENPSSSRRTASSAPVGGVSGSSSSTASRSSKPTVKPVTAPTAAAPVGNALGFEIFSDSAVTANNNPDDILPENPHWKNLGSDKERRKENEGRATAWNEAALPSWGFSRGGSASASSIPAVVPFATAPSAGPSLSIFVDEQFSKEAQEPNESERVAAAAAASVAAGAGAGLSVRRQLDTETGGKAFVKDSVEKIAKNPLSRHLKAAAPTIEDGSEAPTSVPIVPKSLSDVSNAGGVVESQSGKNKKADRSVSNENKSNTSTSRTSVVSSATPSAPMAPSSGGFTIFSDGPPAPPAPPAAVTVSKTKSSSSVKSDTASAAGGGGGFTIFSDAAPTDKKVAPVQSTKVKPVHQAVAAPLSGGFTIFSDSAPVPTTATPAVAAAAAAAAAAPFTIFSDAPPPVKTVKTASGKTVTAPIIASSSSSSSSAGFTIFSDAPDIASVPATKMNKTAATAVPTVAPTALGFSIFSDSQDVTSAPAKAKTVTAPSFSIFSDSQPEPAPVSNVTTAPAFTIFSDSMDSPILTKSKSVFETEDSALKRKEQQETDELESILATMIDLDNEDGTINTRLARHEIDAMFFSPVQASKRPATTSNRMQGGGGGASKIVEEPKVFSLARVQPFGHKADPTNFSAVKDISVIKESSQEYSMCGSISTPFVGNLRSGVRSSFSAGMVFDEDSKGSNSMYISHSSSSAASQHHHEDVFEERDDATAQIQELLHKKHLNNSVLAADGASVNNNKRKALSAISSSSMNGIRDTDLLPSRRKQYATLSVMKSPTVPPTALSAQTIIVPLHVPKVLEIDVTEFERLKLQFIPTAVQHLEHPESTCAVFDHHLEMKPKCFIYRSKPFTHPYQLSQRVTVQPISMVGRGAFGYAIVMKTVKNKVSSSESEDSKVYKVDPDKSYVVWEAFIHSVIQRRLYHHTGYLRRMSQSMIVPDQLWLYSDSSVLRMEYATLGTLVDVLKVFVSGCGSLLSTTEHEYLTCLLSIQVSKLNDFPTLSDIDTQMLEAIEVLHKADIIHCDIKSDNWVLKDETTTDFQGVTRYRLQICLIDFGKARPTTMTCNATSHQIQHFNISHAFAETRDDSRLAALAFQGGSKKESGKHQLSVRRYSIDYVGLTGCVHNLLFLTELSTENCTLQDAGRRGYSLAGRNDSESILVPRSSLKRYWKSTWAELFPVLLNSNSIVDQVDLLHLTASMENSLSNLLTDVDKQNALRKLTTALRQGRP